MELQYGARLAMWMVIIWNQFMSEDVGSMAERHAGNVSGSWDKEARTPRHVGLKSEFLTYRSKLFNAKAEAPNEPLVDMAYVALTEISTAMKELFNDPLAVADVTSLPGELYGQKKNHINGTRNGFMGSIARAMEALNITPEDLQRAIDKRREIDEKFDKKDSDSSDNP